MPCTRHFQGEEDMGPRISISIIILALCAVVLAYSVDHSTSSPKASYIAVGTPLTSCKKLSPVKKELQHAHFTVTGGNGKNVTVTGLVFTACVDPALFVAPQTLDMFYEQVKEVLYQHNEVTPFKSALEVKTEAATIAQDIVKTYPSYQGKMTIYVGTQPETAERLSFEKETTR